MGEEVSGAEKPVVHIMSAQSSLFGVVHLASIDLAALDTIEFHLHSHWFRWHHREVLGRGEVREAESVPQHDVFVVEIGGGVGGDPGWEALGGFAGGLWDVAACGVELGVVV